jgi:hypothetical protein
MDARREIAQRMAGAAVEFLDSLDEHQRGLAQWPVDDHDERTRFFYTPTDHGGLTIGAMRPRQQQLAHRLVASGLSRAAYDTVALVMGLENLLDLDEGFRPGAFGRERLRDPGMYFLRVFGDPAGEAPWGWRFGGHHVSVNHLVVDGAAVAVTPCFLGCDPAEAPLLGPHLLRPLAAAEDLGRELVRSLDDAQRSVAVLAPVAPTDLVSGNRPRYGLGDGDLPMSLGAVWRQRFDGDDAVRFDRAQAATEASLGLAPEHLEAVRLSAGARGLAASAMRSDQREILRALLDVYVGRMPDELAAVEAAAYAGETALGALRFAWAGGLEPKQGHYYRVQGADLLAEYDNTQRGANHIHTVWRHPRRDFGLDVLEAHYAASHPTARDAHGHGH